MDGEINILFVVMPPPLREFYRPIYHVGKLQMMIPLSLVQWRKTKLRGESYGPNHPHQMDHEDHIVMMMTHAYKPLRVIIPQDYHSP